MSCPLIIISRGGGNCPFCPPLPTCLGFGEGDWLVEGDGLDRKMGLVREMVLGTDMGWGRGMADAL